MHVHQPLPRRNFEPRHRAAAVGRGLQPLPQRLQVGLVEQRLGAAIAAPSIAERVRPLRLVAASLLTQSGESATISATSAVECPFAKSQIVWQWLRSTILLPPKPILQSSTVNCCASPAIPCLQVFCTAS